MELARLIVLFDRELCAFASHVAIRFRLQNTNNILGDSLTAILIIGKLPPPVGGVSKYVEGQLCVLRAQGYDVDVISTASGLVFDGFLKAKIFRKYRDIYLNTINIWVLVLLSLCCVLGRVAITDHNHSRKYYGRGGIERKIYSILVRMVREVRVVNPDQSPFYLELGVEPVLVPVFSPPKELSEVADVNIPEETEEYFQRYHSMLLVAAWRYRPEDDDLYGIVRCLELVQELNMMDEGCSFGLIIAIGDKTTSLDSKITKLITDADAHLVLGEDNLWPYYARCDLLLRLTATDGDSVSVREAIYSGCLVVASDVVSRPESVVVVDPLSPELASLIRGLIRKECA